MDEPFYTKISVCWVQLTRELHTKFRIFKSNSFRVIVFIKNIYVTNEQANKLTHRIQIFSVIILAYK